MPVSEKHIPEVSAADFEELAIEIFQQQYRQNNIYRQFTDALHIDPVRVKNISQIPFLPISFFKTHKVLSYPVADPELVFESSTTTGNVPSKHYVASPELYKTSLLGGFKQFYGNPQDYAILALLPSYLERGNASLVYMAKTLMEISAHKANGFYLDEYDKLHAVLSALEQQGQSTLLIGVTFALLDFAAQCPMQLKHIIVMETGGMKGRRQELTREEVHKELQQQLGIKTVHSEYGMTELLSQAYSKGNGIFECTDTMQVFVRDINDPLDVKTTGSGALNIIDLANLHSCSFIATDDIGTIAADGSFRVMGRLDNSALRGCNLMVI